MGALRTEIFVCLDCEATGLDVKEDRVVEVAAARFDFSSTYETFESLIDPVCDIPLASQEIHKISQKMVQGKPKIQEVLPTLFQLIDRFILVGHGIPFDLALLQHEAMRMQVPCPLSSCRYIDTLRLARLYGESPVNSLEMLRKHFNIAPEGAHRAMSDVLVNIEVFKYLAHSFERTEDILQRLDKPILLKTMPLGKHKGRKFDEIPLEYLLWASRKEFDQDLLFSIRTELKNRKKGNRFEQVSNPFFEL